MAPPSALYAAYPVDISTAQIRLICLEPCPSHDQEDNNRFTSHLESLNGWEPRPSKDEFAFASHLEDLRTSPNNNISSHEQVSRRGSGRDWNRGQQDQVKCRLHLADLKVDLSQYIALSYEWGDPSEGMLPIKLDGNTFPVRKNLYSALWHIRSETCETRLWVDALCIDQENQEERNHQVNYMGTIYSRADRVVAWLGTPDRVKDDRRAYRFVSDGEKAATLLSRYNVDDGRQGSAEEQAMLFWGAPPLPSMAAAVAATDASYFSDMNLACSCVLHLCRRKYWSRLWIIQELVLARRIELLCGKYRIQWNSLKEFFDKPPNLGDTGSLKGRGSQPDLQSTSSQVEMYDLMDTVPAKILQQKAKARETAQTNNSATLFELIHTYKNASCADVRDKVFGLRSLSQPCCQAGLQVDYSRRPAEVWISVLQHYTTYHQQILCLKGIWYQAAFYKIARDVFRILSGGEFSNDFPTLRSETSGGDNRAKLSEKKSNTMVAGMEVEPAKLWIWIEDLARIDNDHQEALSRQTIKPSTLDVDMEFPIEDDQMPVWYPSKQSVSATSTNQAISTSYQYTIGRSQEVVVHQLDGTICEGNFSSRGLTIRGRSSLESGDLVQMINDNEFIVLRKESSQFTIMGKARRKVLVPVSGNRRLNPSIMLWMDISAFEAICRLNFESCALRFVQE
ncbi:uncharacterized protein PAC_07644 [Phialocephala subalpina]|uniref:Heterokaryon incompatibility domain-containing protein n=1 Tax=Phialocephala subalpina TaxID=576137 RepID=A0A1L7WYB7_9HELO|nr:uncharacterized protein PAC_07644 [Phialocephala subalpina]